jgi:tetratricopeptide (TPR) repeat protein
MGFLNDNDFQFRSNRDYDSYIPGLYQEAIDGYSEAITLAPDDPEAYEKNGDLFFNSGQYEQALHTYNRLIKSHPHNMNAYYNRGLVYAELGEHGRAVEDYTNAIVRDPGFGAAYTNRGISYARLGKYEQAIDDYGEAIRLNPKDILAYVNRWIAYRKAGKNYLADKDYRILFEINPENAKMHVDRALACEQYGSYREALKMEVVNELLAEKDALEEEASLQAIENYSRFIDLNPNDAVIYFKRGLTYQKLRKYAPAVKDYDKAITLHPQYEEARNERRIALERLLAIRQLFGDIIDDEDIE